MSAPRMTQKFESMAVGGTEVDIDKAWIACNHPERPPDRNVMYHVIPDCHGCNVAKDAARRLENREFLSESGP